MMAEALKRSELWEREQRKEKPPFDPVNDPIASKHL
jgi:hypothetical protein